MTNRLLITLTVLNFWFASCADKKAKPIEKKETSKFIISSIKARTSQLIYHSEDDSFSLTYDTLIWYSEIETITDYTENKSYEFADKYLKVVSQKLDQDNYKTELKIDFCRLSDENKILFRKAAKPKILDVENLTFDTYKEASIQRRKLTE